MLSREGRQEDRPRLVMEGASINSCRRRRAALDMFGAERDAEPRLFQQAGIPTWKVVISCRSAGPRVMYLEQRSRLVFTAANSAVADFSTPGPPPPGVRIKGRVEQWGRDCVAGSETSAAGGLHHG